MRYLNVLSLLFFAVSMMACGGGGGGAVSATSTPAAPETPVSSLTVSWDYYDANYLSDYQIEGVKVYVGGAEVCSADAASVLNDKTMTCDVSALSLTAPLSFTLTAYDTDGYESPKSEVFTIS